MNCSQPGSPINGIFQARILSELPFPTPEDLPNPGIELTSLVSPALQADSLLLRHQGSLAIKFSSVQSLNCVRLFATPWTVACQASLSITKLPEFTQTHIH